MDLSSSLLTGRPPALSSRYTRFKLPLDLNDDAIMAGGEVLRHAIEHLDEKGWNTMGQFRSHSHLRASGMLAPILNETLELVSDDLDALENY